MRLFVFSCCTIARNSIRVKSAAADRSARPLRWELQRDRQFVTWTAAGGRRSAARPQLWTGAKRRSGDTLPGHGYSHCRPLSETRSVGHLVAVRFHARTNRRKKTIGLDDLQRVRQFVRPTTVADTSTFSPPVFLYFQIARHSSERSPSFRPPASGIAAAHRPEPEQAAVRSGRKLMRPRRQGE